MITIDVLIFVTIWKAIFLLIKSSMGYFPWRSYSHKKLPSYSSLIRSGPWSRSSVRKTGSSSRCLVKLCGDRLGMIGHGDGFRVVKTITKVMKSFVVCLGMRKSSPQWPNI